MKYFVDKNGKYLGGFDAGSQELVPGDAVEIPAPPMHGMDERKQDGTWDISKRPVRTEPAVKKALKVLLSKYKTRFAADATELNALLAEIDAEVF